MVSLPGNRKTTRAKQPEKEDNLIRFMPDYGYPRLFGDDADRPEHDKWHAEVKKIMKIAACRDLLPC